MHASWNLCDASLPASRSWRGVRPQQVLCASIEQPTTLTTDPRVGSLRKVIHCAALTSFGASRRAFAVNATGTLHFVEQLRALTDIERFVHVSTAMICGEQPAAVVEEDDFPRLGVRHLVSYTASKAEAELQLRTRFADFPWVVARPSIIVGHSELGCQPSGSIFWAFRIADALGGLPLAQAMDIDTARIDVIPVDYAAHALLLLLSEPHLAQRTYHISAGAESSCRWPQIAAAFARAHGTSQRSYRGIELAEVAAHRRQFEQLFGSCNQAFVMRAMRLYGAFAALNCVFANQRLRSQGCAPAPRFCDYLGECVRTSQHLGIAEQMLADF